MVEDAKLYQQMRANVVARMEGQIQAGVIEEACKILDRHESNIGHIVGMVSQATTGVQNIQKMYEALNARVNALETPLPGENKPRASTKPN